MQNRKFKFGRWGSLILKILLVIIILNFIRSFNSGSAKSMLWFMSGGNDKYLNESPSSNK